MSRIMLSAIGADMLWLLIGPNQSPAAEVSPTPDEINKITQAAPAQAAAKPLQPRKLLVFTLTHGFRHSSVPVAAKALEILGQKTGTYETVVSDDIAMFDPAKLQQFDAVCMDNTTGELFLPRALNKLSGDEQTAAKQRAEALKKSLLDFVRGGKGIVGLHAATDCFYQWPEYGQLMGGYFAGHPWGKVMVKLDDPAHPLNAAFKGQGFEISDEIYTFRAPYSREALRVLLSVDWEKSNLKKGNRADNDYALSWVRSYGQGRVFYCAFGHQHDIFWNRPILQHMLDGLQFALGDLKADTTPSAKLTGSDSSGTPASASGWQELFNGKDLAGWKAKAGSWLVEEGVLARKGGGDIWTEKRFGDFVLDLEFKIDKGVNSGIFIRTDNPRDCVQTGIEIQVLDSFGKTKVGKHDCGAVYDCLAPSKNTVKAPGQWNHIVITCRANKIAVALNDESIIDMDLNLWTEPNKNPDGAKNKFRTAYKDLKREGHIGIQDHGGSIWCRNIKLKPL